MEGEKKKWKKKKKKEKMMLAQNSVSEVWIGMPGYGLSALRILRVIGGGRLSLDAVHEYVAVR